MPDLGSLEKKALSELKKVNSKDTLESLRVKYLGRKGELTGVLRSLKDLAPAKRKSVGAQANKLKDKLQEAIDERFLEFGSDNAPNIDITRPGKKIQRGYVHPLTLVEREVRRIFLSLNFSVVEGPEMETEFYNFDALNLPEWHPAREEWDTYWIKQDKKVKEKKLLRTHTSPVQVRYMEEHQPPFQIIVPGRVFRYEATDATHEDDFYQFEGLMVGKDVTLANFKYVITKFFEEFFKGQDIEFRFRPSYFPFVEPGVEVDVRFKGGDWLEMLGAGMVHPHVFEAAHYNPREYQGFAFGVGIDRLAMIKYKVPDIRMFYSGDLRFIKQF